MGYPAPKPHNFDALTFAWNNPHEFANQTALYYSQLAREGLGESVDWTEARHGTR